ncbi:MAG: hypothetical protein ACE5H3_03170 [Planctomycetota bacterium]
MPDLDPFTDKVLARMDQKTLQTFTGPQLKALDKVLRRTPRSKKHGLDVRGTIPLYFARYYFVLLMGKDRRVETWRTEEERRKRGRRLVWVAFLIILLVLFAMILLGVAYVLKSAFGIDIFPDFHIEDFF